MANLGKSIHAKLPNGIKVLVLPKDINISIIPTSIEDYSVMVGSS